MRRMVRGSVALLLGVAVVVIGPGALAQETTTTTTAPPGYAITVTPDTVDQPKEKIKITGPGFPDAIGCKFGIILASGPTLAEPKVLLRGDFDSGWSTDVDRWDDPARSYFTAGVFDLTMSCTDEAGNANTYPTGATLTVLPSGVPPPDPTTTTQAPTTTVAVTTTTIGTNGTVDPSTATAGVTTVTLRGNGFKPLASLDITLNSRPVTKLGTTNAREDGTYAATILIPATAPSGKRTLLVTGPGPDGVTRSTTAELLIVGGATATRRTAAATGSGTAAAGTLAATGPNESTPYFVIAGLTAMTLGAFLVGMSHPAVPSEARRGRRRRGQHFR